MDVENFKECLELMSHSGFRLTDLEAGLIENSLVILQSDNKLQKMFFFGKIATSGDVFRDYYVAFGYQTDVFTDRKFFYSQNGYEWVIMPDMRPKMIPICLQTRSLLTGDPMNVEAVWMPPTFIADPENVFQQCPRKSKKVKEEDRLSIIVHLLMTQAALMPRGYLYRQITKNITPNPCFTGLNRASASEMKNFQLFRYPLNNRNQNMLKHEDFNYQTDFFDTIDDVIPKNCCFSYEINDQNVCLIRALHWPGMVFFHKLNTKYQGFFYIGNGKRNLDLLFMT